MVTLGHPIRLAEAVSAPLGDARRARGWSLRTAGEAVACSHFHVWRLELGWCRPTRPLAVRLVVVYGLDADDAAAVLGAAYERWPR